MKNIVLTITSFLLLAGSAWAGQLKLKCPTGYTLKAVCDGKYCQKPGNGCDCNEHHTLGTSLAWAWTEADQSLPDDCHNKRRQEACVRCCTSNQIKKCINDMPPFNQVDSIESK